MSEELPTLNYETNLRRAENILFSEIDQDKVMIDLERGTYFGLNPVSGEIWDLLETPHTPGQIIQKLLEAYEIDETTCQTETLGVLERMLRLGLVELVD